MKRLVTIVVAAALAAAACKKDKKDEGGTAASGSDTATGSAEPIAAGSGSGPASAAPDPGSGAGPPTTGSAAPGPGSDTGAAPARPATITDADVAMADKLAVAIEKLSADVVAAGADCKKMTAAIKSNTKAVSDAIASLDKMKKTNDTPEAKAWFKATYEPKIGPPMKALVEAAKTNCEKDADVKAALGGLSLLKQKAPPPPSP